MIGRVSAGMCAGQQHSFQTEHSEAEIEKQMNDKLPMSERELIPAVHRAVLLKDQPWKCV